MRILIILCNKRPIQLPYIADSWPKEIIIHFYTIDYHVVVNEINILSFCGDNTY